MSEPSPTVTIPLSVYNDLLMDQRFLRALQAAGVDNWDGYEFAQDILDPDGEAQTT